MQRWWQHKDEGGPKRDIVDALTALRADVENANQRPAVALSHLGTYRKRELTAVRTIRVGEWVFGYKIEPIDEDQGFFVRTLYVKLLGGRLDELNKREQENLIASLSGSVLDPGTSTMVEQVADDALAIRQPFAVMFAHERNTNIVTPSKKLLLASFDPAKNKPSKPEMN